MRRQDLLAAERQELAREPRGALRARADLVDILAPPVRRGEAAAQVLGVAHDHGEDVVEVVGDAAGQPPDGFHLLRLAQPLFELDPRGDVANDQLPRGPAAEDDRNSHHLHFDHAAVETYQA